MLMSLFSFFFFKQNTAYELRISDWSSDVCSSDLADTGISEIMINRHDEIYVERNGRLWRHDAAFSSEQSVRWVIERIVAPLGRRSEGRRVGKEGVSTCRSRWSPSH